jgi:hypothetical protein
VFDFMRPTEEQVKREKVPEKSQEEVRKAREEALARRDRSKKD